MHLVGGYFYSAAGGLCVCGWDRYNVAGYVFCEFERQRIGSGEEIKSPHKRPQITPKRSISCRITSAPKTKETKLNVSIPLAGFDYHSYSSPAACHHSLSRSPLARSAVCLVRIESRTRPDPSQHRTSVEQRQGARRRATKLPMLSLHSSPHFTFYPTYTW